MCAFPTWRAGEALLFIEALARNLGAEGSDVLFTMRWTGLAGRELVSVGNPNRILFDGRRARQDTIDRELRMSVAKISDTLPELVHTLLEPLYELFDFIRLPAKLVGEELTAMRGRRF